MIVLAFDTETNGLPKKYDAPVTQVDNWPRVIQMAWLLSDGDGHVEREFLIRPDGWVVPEEKFWIDNGFTTEKCFEEGVPIEQVLEQFIKDLQWADVITAHNMQFDYGVVGSEMIRKGYTAGKKVKRICTKEESTEFCKLPGPRGYKWPKLEELHRVLFGVDFENAHDALSDVFALDKCFWELLNRNVIKL